MTTENSFESVTAVSKGPERKVLDINGDLTETIWWSAEKKKPEEDTFVFFMIPGNPGVIDYYIPFLNTIFAEHEGKIEIVGVSHLGHSHGPHFDHLHKLWTLDDQIQHKINFFDLLREKYSTGDGDNKRSPRLFLCGHSVGAYICSQVFKARPNHGIEKVYSLFPTLQHIAKTPNGIRLSWLFYERPRNISSTLIHLMRVTYGFKQLVRLFTSQSEPHLSVTTDKLLHYHVVQNALYMSDFEMRDIQHLDEEFYREYLDKFVFYFGKTDDWAPMEHYFDMLQRFPNGKILLCDVGMEHAFVLEHSEEMGRRVAHWIKDSSSI